MRLRFAPSPTGTLHVGGARTAVFNWLLARKHRGTFILRIEDTDRERSTEASRDAILDSLAWLGLAWDEGPVYQSQRVGRHVEAAHRLLASGGAYRCFCTPEELATERAEAQAARRNYVYSRRCRSLAREAAEARAASGESFTVRFAVPPGRTEWDDLVHGRTGFDNDQIGDFIVLRSDGGPVYNLAATVDDLDMGVTHVIRGDDHISNTPRQILIYRALGAEPPSFGHVPLLFGPDRQKLSKRHGAQSVEEFRALGILPQALVNFLALLGWSPGDDREVMDLPELVESFSVERITGKSAVFETGKLEWLNGQHLARLSGEDLGRAVAPWFLRAGIATAPELETRRAWFLDLLLVLRPRARLLSDFTALGRPYFPVAIEYRPDAVAKFWADPAAARELLAGVRAALAELPDLEDKARTEARIRRLADERGVEFPAVVHPLRVALTGMRVSPGIFEVLQLMGRELALRRIDDALLHLARPSPRAGGGDVTSSAEAPPPEPPPPGSPAGTPAPAGAGVPWERRHALGVFRALVQSVGDSVLHPSRFFRQLSPTGGTGPALLYAILVGWTAFLLAAFWDAVLPGPWPGWFSQAGAHSSDEGSRLVGLGLAIFTMPIVIPIGVFVLSLLYHGLLLLFGGPSRGFEGTIKTVAYASGVQLLNVVPICGAFLVLVWGLVVQVIGLREVHGIPTGKAVAVALVPYLLCVILVLAAIVFVLLAVPGELHDVLRRAGS